MGAVVVAGAPDGVMGGRSVTGVIRRPFGRLRRRRAEGSEHGAVATLVAIMLAGGVVLGMSAVVIDAGQLYVEREELQSGADAASFKVALACVKVPVDCTVAKRKPDALLYAQKNARDGQADVQLCFNGTGCPAWNPSVDCRALPSPSAGNTNGSYVEVRTSTVTSSGSTLLPPIVAGALPGTPYTGTKVGACARVSWGPPADVGRVFALGISLCDYNRATANNTKFYAPLVPVVNNILPMLGLPAVAPASDFTIPKNTATSSCNDNLLFPVGVRGYAWLRSTDSSLPDAECTVSVNVGDSPSNAFFGTVLEGRVCPDKLNARLGTVFLVPIYDTISYVLLTPKYHLVGFAPFVLTSTTGITNGLLGGLLSAVLAVLAPILAGLINNVSNVLGASAQGSSFCGGSCITGYFSQSLVPMAMPQFGTGGNFGATVIGRTG